MKTSFLFFVLLGFGFPVFAQQPLAYTVWADGLAYTQLPKSSLYSLGAGARFEVSRPFRNPVHALFVQAGGGRFFQKPGGAFTASFALLNAGYRYQPRQAFNASVGIGAQFWRERMQLRQGEDRLVETFRNLLPSANVAIGFRLKTHYRLGVEYRGLFKLEPDRTVLRNNLALVAGYTF